MQTFSRNYKNYAYGHDTQSRMPASKSGSYTKRLMILVALVLLCLAAKTMLAANKGFAPQNRQPAAGSEVKKEEPPAPPPKKLVDMSGLAGAIDQINAKYPAYNTSVAVVELNSGKLIQTGDTYPYVAASTTKLLTALYFFNKVENGEEQLTKVISGKTAQEQMRLMINRSDNVAWHQLNTYLSKASLQQFGHAQGLTSYDAEKNTMTSTDMARLMAKIYNKELANEQHTALLYSWMQNTSEERFIPPSVPAGMTFYHKAGYLADRAHDVAIIDNGSTPFAVVVFSKSYTSTYDYLIGQKIFKQVMAQTLSTFNQ